MSDVVYLDDVDVSTLGLKTVAIPGWLDGVDRQWQYTSIPGRDGGIVSTLSTSPGRPLSIQGYVQGATAANRADAVRKLHAAALGTRDDGRVRIRFGDRPNQEVYARYTSAPANAISRLLEMAANSRTLIALDFFCEDPAFLDTADQTVSAIGSGGKSIPTGTLPQGGVLTITGAATNPVVTYKDASGTTVGTMSFTVSLGAGATLTIDFGRQTITSSTTANAVPLWTGFVSGESFIRIDPRHGDFGSSTWPTLRVSSGTGEYVYKRRWAA